MNVMLTLFLLLATACSDEPQPCDDLCEAGGFEGIEETEAGCTCSSSEGLGGEITDDACAGYCEAIGADPDDAVVSSDGESHSCSCDGGAS